LIWREVAPDGVADAGETVIARYEYDALNRRTKEFINADTDDDFDSFRHFYYAGEKKGTCYFLVDVGLLGA